jgi:hypothetical protein
MGKKTPPSSSPAPAAVQKEPSGSTIHGSSWWWWRAFSRAAERHARQTERRWARSAGKGRCAITRPTRSGGRSRHGGEDDAGEVAGAAGIVAG